MKMKAVILSLTIALMSTTLCSALTHLGASTTRGLTVKVSSWFHPNHIVTSSDGYGAKVGKNINRSYVRLTQGGYDSGKVWTELATSKTDSDLYIVSKSRINNPFTTTATYFGWSYFK
ncbi:MAG: hypothetical protein ACOYIG_07215 [Acetivibrionales bacterium]|jgi:hypothetical protein